jgi:signal transduction histidine kinase
MLMILGIQVLGAHIAGSHQSTARHLDALGYALLFATALPLAFRVRARVPAFAVTLIATVAYVVLDYPDGPVFLALLVSIFGAVRSGHRVAVWIGLAAGYVAFITVGRICPHIGSFNLVQPNLLTSIQVVVWFVLALALAEGIRVRAAHFNEVRRTMAEQARARAEQQRRQASEERLQIAQELHDVLGHHLSLINVQAGVGLHLMADQPDQARAALEAIKLASAEALGEVRGVLGALRPKDERAPRAPAPSLANLSTLIEPARTVTSGAARPLPPDVDRAAYRIVQESLTNVRRHAGPDATATITITYESRRLLVRIADNGRPGAPGGADVGGSGTGIAGMRTRAEALGGLLVTGQGIDGGFVVSASLPIPPLSIPSPLSVPSPSGPPASDPSPSALDPDEFQPTGESA